MNAISAFPTAADVLARAMAGAGASSIRRHSDYGLVGFGYEPDVEDRWSPQASLMFIATASLTLWTLIVLTFIRIF